MPAETEPRNSGTPPPPASSFLPKGKNFLFVIGIDDYLYIRKLNNAVKDVEDFVRLLTDKYSFEKENIFTLFNASATRSAIFKELRVLAQKVGSNDSIVIYYSGHGYYDTAYEEGYWIPADAHYDADDEYIANQSIFTILNAVKSRHTFLISDSCFSGSLFSGEGRDMISERYEKDPSRWALTSGRNEIVEDGPKGENSPFAKTLLQILNASQRDLGVMDLCGRVMENVPANAAQRPRGEPIRVAGHQGGQFFFHLRYNEEADWKAATAADALPAYRAYLEKYPAGKYTAAATSKIGFWEEENAWLSSENRNSIGAYSDYIGAYRNGRYYELALNRLKQAEETKAFNDSVRTNTLYAYYTFLHHYPESAQALEIKKRIDVLNKKESDPDVETTPAIEIPEETAPLENKPVVAVSWPDQPETRIEEKKGFDFPYADPPSNQPAPVIENRRQQSSKGKIRKTVPDLNKKLIEQEAVKEYKQNVLINWTVAAIIGVIGIGGAVLWRWSVAKAPELIKSALTPKNNVNTGLTPLDSSIYKNTRPLPNSSNPYEKRSDNSEKKLIEGKNYREKEPQKY